MLIPDLVGHLWCIFIKHILGKQKFDYFLKLKIKKREVGNLQGRGKFINQAPRQSPELRS
jgi:hypothetical protein